MNLEYGLETLVDNFDTECRSITSVADFTESAATDLMYNMASLPAELKDLGYEALTDISDRVWEIFTPQFIGSELQGEIYATLQHVLPEIQERTGTLMDAAAKLKLPEPQLDTPTYRETVAYIQKYHFEASNPHVSLEKMKAIRVAALSRTREGAITQGDSETGFSWYLFLNLAVQEAEYRAAWRKAVKHRTIQDTIEHLISVRNLPDPEDITNPWRQSFVTIMARFEATVFDIVGIGFRKDFFRVLRGFAGANNEKKYTLKEMAELGSFDKLRDAIIEEHLKNSYIRETMLRLRDVGIPNSSDFTEDKFNRLIETILRRNAHLHHRGIVDQKYLSDTQSRFNVDQLRFGAQATVDDTYLGQACKLCSDYVHLLADWAK